MKQCTFESQARTCRPIGNADLQPLIYCKVHSPVGQKSQQGGCETSVKSFDSFLCKNLTEAPCSSNMHAMR